MSREEAIGFLQEIKYNLDYLQTHYAAQRLRSALEDKIQNDKQENQLAVSGSGICVFPEADQLFFLYDRILSWLIKGLLPH
jgi:hypothetical protein